MGLFYSCQTHTGWTNSRDEKCKTRKWWTITDDQVEFPTVLALHSSIYRCIFSADITWLHLPFMRIHYYSTGMVLIYIPTYKHHVNNKIINDIINYANQNFSLFFSHGHQVIQKYFTTRLSHICSSYTAITCQLMVQRLNAKCQTTSNQFHYTRLNNLIVYMSLYHNNIKHTAT